MVKKYIIGLILSLCAHVAISMPISTISYDITDTHTSGQGGWAHTYDGTITTITGNIANYSGGSGTLNDGIIGTSEQTTQLFYTADTNPVITLFLDGFYSIDSLLIYGGNITNNGLPGTLTGFDVTVNSITESFLTTAQGLTGFSGLSDDFVDFTGSSLAGLVTDRIILSGFDNPTYNALFTICFL